MIADLVAWYKEDRSQIRWTVGGAVLSTLMGLFVENVRVAYGNFMSGDYEGFSLILSDTYNFLIQTVFIIIAIFVLLKSRRGTLQDLKYAKQITSYINENCNVKVYNEKDNLNRYLIVRQTTLKFYYLWLSVWGLWLCYYMGNLLFSVFFRENQISLTRLIYSQVFDFMSSLVLLGIYLILTEATERRRDGQRGDEEGMWGGLLFVIVLTILFFVGLVYEASIYHHAGNRNEDFQTIQPNIVSVSLSVFSAMCFVLVLGKINSNYMRIPNAFLIGMYVYAIMQCYVPFSVLNTPYVFRILEISLPYITLMGKMVVLLSLCWITYQKRLIFFVIHRSTAIDNIPRMLS